MFNNLSIIFIIKQIIYIGLFFTIFMTPAYLARINEKDAYNMLIVRLSSWLLGWTLLGWFFALYWAIKK